MSEEFDFKRMNLEDCKFLTAAQIAEMKGKRAEEMAAFYRANKRSLNPMQKAELLAVIATGIERKRLANKYFK